MLYMPTHRFALTALAAAMVCHAASANTDSVLLAQAIAPAAPTVPATVGAPPTQPPLQNSQRNMPAGAAPAPAAAQAQNSSAPAPGASRTEPQAQNAEPKAPDAAEGTFSVEADGVRIMRGTDQVIARPRLPHKADGAASTFKFEEAPISEIVHVMLGELL
jgi:hypothetical protein